MCAIVDTNVSHEVFGSDRSPRGQLLYDWLTRRRTGKLVVGGQLRRELLENCRIRTWLQQALVAGRAKAVCDSQVDTMAESLRTGKDCKSDDEHVIALARISGARLLFTDDHNLERDFKNRKLVSGPGGKIYKSTDHKRLLTQRDLCKA